MTREGDQETKRYVVVVNDEEQHSIWPEELEIPLGWTAAGHSGDKASCLEFVRRAWPDIRPLSVRRRLEELAEEKREEQR